MKTVQRFVGYGIAPVVVLVVVVFLVGAEAIGDALGISTETTMTVLVPLGLVLIVFLAGLALALRVRRV